MWKLGVALGLALVLAGVAGASWPRESTFARSRRLVGEPTWTSRGPRVTVDRLAATVHDAAGRAISISGVLSADGYWVRSLLTFITREELAGVDVLVLRQRPDALDDGRTRTLVTRWIDEGGAVLVFAPGAPGAPGAAARQIQGAGRIATLDLSALDTADAVAALLNAMHWLSGVREV